MSRERRALNLDADDPVLIYTGQAGQVMRQAGYPDTMSLHASVLPRRAEHPGDEDALLATAFVAIRATMAALHARDVTLDQALAAADGIEARLLRVIDAARTAVARQTGGTDR